MKSDEELKKNFTMYIDRDGIVKCEWLVEPADREENYRQAQLWAEAAQKVLDDNPGKDFKFLIDLSPAGVGLSQPPPKQSRELYKKRSSQILGG